MIYSEFDKKNQLLLVKFEGIISMKEIEHYYDGILSNVQLPKVLRIFQDETRAEFINSSYLILNTVQWIRKITEKYDRVKVAVWQSRPVETAYSFLFADSLDINNYEIKIFNTREGAFYWLNL